MTQVREAVESTVQQLVNEHVPHMWRRRAMIYVPLIVDRITQAVEAIRGGSDD